MLAKLLLRVCLLSLNQDIHWRECTTLVMLAKLLYAYAYSLWIKIYIKGKVQHWSCWQSCCYEYAYSLWIKIYIEGNVQHWSCWQNCFMRMLTLSESRYTLKGRYNIGHVGKAAATSMLTLFESRYTLKGIEGTALCWQTASMSMLTLLESRYTFYNQPASFSLLRCVGNFRIYFNVQSTWKSIGSNVIVRIRMTAPR